MNAKLLKLLLAGEYICPIRYRTEFDILCDPHERDDIDEWLMSLGMRMAHLGEDGAFFIAHNFISTKEINQVKHELSKFRDEYGPFVLMLDFIRQTDAGQVQLSPGDFIQLFKLEDAVAQSTMMDMQLKTLLSVITHSAMRNSNHENLKKLMDHLARDGYVYLVDKDTGSYQVTGKIEQLYAVLQFLEENKVVADTEIDDSEEVQEDLVEQAQGDEADEADVVPSP